VEGRQYGWYHLPACSPVCGLSACSLFGVSGCLRHLFCSSRPGRRTERRFLRAPHIAAAGGLFGGGAYERRAAALLRRRRSAAPRAQRCRCARHAILTCCLSELLAGGTRGVPLPRCAGRGGRAERSFSSPYRLGSRRLSFCLLRIRRSSGASRAGTADAGVHAGCTRTRGGRRSWRLPGRERGTAAGGKPPFRCSAAWHSLLCADVALSRLPSPAALPYQCLTENRLGAARLVRGRAEAGGPAWRCSRRCARAAGTGSSLAKLWLYPLPYICLPLARHQVLRENRLRRLSPYLHIHHAYRKRAAGFGRMPACLSYAW